MKSLIVLGVLAMVLCTKGEDAATPEKQDGKSDSGIAPVDLYAERGRQISKRDDDDLGYGHGGHGGFGDMDLGYGGDLDLGSGGGDLGHGYGGGYGHDSYEQKKKVITHYVSVPKYVPVVKYNTKYVPVPVYKTVVKPIYKTVKKPIVVTKTKYVHVPVKTYGHDSYGYGHKGY